MPQVARRLAVDARAGTGTSSDTNGVLEPGESVLVEPAWTYQGYSAATLTGAASALTGPAGASYTLADAAASYGAVPAVDDGNGAAVDCFGATGNCYRLQVSSPAARPAAHWDAAVTETMSTSGIKKWMLHVGDSFGDVPRDHPFYARIETLFHSGVTSGCTAGAFCPDETVPRSQMAIFIANTLARGGANVPASGTWNGNAYACVSGGVSLFADVAPTDIFCKHVHSLALQNVTLGCSAGLYCPDVVRLAPRDGGLHREGNAGAGRRSGGAGGLWSGPRDGPVVQLRRREPRVALCRRARVRPVLQARPLPLGHRSDRGLLAHGVLSDAARQAQRDGRSS